MTRPSSLLRLLASAGAVFLALTLAACGVKGGLEPPAASGVAPVSQPAPTNTAVAPEPGPELPYPRSASAEQRTPTSVLEAPAAQRRSPLDWLID